MSPLLLRAGPRRALAVRAAGLAVGLGLALLPSAARADASSWLSVSGGVGHLSWADAPSATAFALPIQVGVGISPSYPVVVGIGFQLTRYFGQTTDLSSYGRVATSGYVLGDYGAALDVGVYGRPFGETSFGLYSAATFGAPWGLIATGFFERGNGDAQTFGVTIGIDFLRLTVYRLAGENQWPNPMPAEGPRR